MLSLFALAVATAQPEGEEPDYSCPAMTLAAGSDRAVTLVATDLSAGRGPVLELQVAATEAETQNFGMLSLVRVSGRIYLGGMLGRRVDDQQRYSFALSFEPEQLAVLSAATRLELVATDGNIIAVALKPSDAAPIEACLDANPYPSVLSQNAETRRSYTFVPSEPNQPLRLRYRGNPSHFYPMKALQEEREGASRVAFTIGASGRITACSVVASSGHEDLDAASCRAARTSIFLPETNAAGEPVEVKREQPLNWVIPK